MDILPDLLSPGLKVVFCGTAPSRQSKKRGAYYANPRNRFWRILHETKLINEPLQPERFLELKALGYGLTDVCKNSFGNDDDLQPNAFDPDRLRSAIEKMSPWFLAFTSGNAGSKVCGRQAKYGWQPSLGSTRIDILPTTSPRRGDTWWNANNHHWHTFAQEVLRSG